MSRDGGEAPCMKLSGWGEYSKSYDKGYHPCRMDQPTALRQSLKKGGSGVSRDGGETPCMNLSGWGEYSKVVVILK